MSSTQRSGAAAAILASILALACGDAAPPPSEEAEIAVPEPDTTDMEPQVERRLEETRTAVLQAPASAAAWGRLGMVAHAHELWDEAIVAYRRAEKLDRSDERWPYFLGDVLTAVGTDLPGAAEAFRRAMALRPEYGPAHMRLGNVLLSQGQLEEAARELERALELAPDLHPARVALAQIRLSQRELERAAELLERVLEEEPRHGRALSTLGQVYMRLGRRDEARDIAQRARDADLYNLYSDPLMSEVVAEGISSVLVWERAQAFFEDGNYEQAVRGLREVVRLKPSNTEARHQLAVALGHVGDLPGSRRQLERTLALAPERTEALVQLASVELDLENPQAAIGHLERYLALRPDDTEARWLLGRAQRLAGSPAAALATFEETAAMAARVPPWAHNEWGSALAETGQMRAALEEFEAALAADPDNAQALFYLGLVQEGVGRLDEAAAYYCRSMSAQANRPAAERLQALGHRCR